MTWKELGFKAGTYRWHDFTPAERALILSFTGWSFCAGDSVRFYAEDGGGTIVVQPVPKIL